MCVPPAFCCPWHLVDIPSRQCTPSESLEVLKVLGALGVFTSSVVGDTDFGAGGDREVGSRMKQFNSTWKSEKYRKDDKYELYVSFLPYFWSHLDRNLE